MNTPLAFRWTGSDMTPTVHSRALCDGRFVIGQVYMLETVEDRSSASHKHYFALVKEAWENLPEAEAEKFPSPEHLRKRALIMSGFSLQRDYACASSAEAMRLATVLRGIDEYAVVKISGPAVQFLTAKSQSNRAMKKADFQRSKDAVLAYASSLIGAPVSELGRAA